MFNSLMPQLDYCLHYNITITIFVPLSVILVCYSSFVTCFEKRDHWGAFSTDWKLCTASVMENIDHKPSQKPFKLRTKQKVAYSSNIYSNDNKFKASIHISNLVRDGCSHLLATVFSTQFSWNNLHAINHYYYVYPVPDL